MDELLIAGKMEAGPQVETYAGGGEDHSWLGISSVCLAALMGVSLFLPSVISAMGQTSVPRIPPQDPRVVIMLIIGLFAILCMVSQGAGRV